MTALKARTTPLLDVHRRLGAKLTQFSGWEMPLQYKGVIAEHNAVRSSAGIFDVSHLGKLRVAGAPGGRALQETLTADVLGLQPGKGSYSLVLREDGGCVDDVFVYRLAEEEWLVVPNAGNVEAVAMLIAESGGEPVDEWDRWAILALQGPRSIGLFERLWSGSGAAELPLYHWRTVPLGEIVVTIARTGYTGERGLEIFVPAAAAAGIFERLVEEGAQPAGLGARDTLRLEMGYALYGHELTTEINPLEAGLGWALAWDTPFRGRAAVARVRAMGLRRGRFGVRCKARGVPRDGYEIRVGEKTAGGVTSGNFSPTLRTGIALALGPAPIPEIGTEVAIAGRGRELVGEVVSLPFVSRRRQDDK